MKEALEKGGQKGAHSRYKVISVKWLILLALAFASARAYATGPDGTQDSVICARDELPQPIRLRLDTEFSDWRIQEVNDLSASARLVWQAETPLTCPGLSIGHFDNDERQSYAVLLVPLSNPKRAHRVVVFRHNNRRTCYEATLLDSSDDGNASNFFIHRVDVSDIIDAHERKKYGIMRREAILMFDAGESEYGVNLYFWKHDHYEHEPLDY